MGWRLFHGGGGGGSFKRWKERLLLHRRGRTWYSGWIQSVEYVVRNVYTIVYEWGRN